MQKIVGAAIEAARALRQALVRLDPGSLSGWEAVELVETLAGVEKVFAGTLAQAAVRIEQCGAWQARGHRSGAEWLAKTVGTSQGQATATIETAKAVEGLAATREAFMAGRISEAQAAEVAKAAAAGPTAEAGLLQVAEHGDWRSLKAQARRVRLNAEVDREALHARQDRAREFHHWIDDEGMVAGRFRLPPEVGAPGQPHRHPDRPRIPPGLAAGRAGATGRLRRRRPGQTAVRPRRRQAHAGGRGSGRRPRRPTTRPHPRRRTVPNSRVRSASGGGGPRYLLRRLPQGGVVQGREIRKVKHFGRDIPAEVRTALELGPGHELDGATCGGRLRTPPRPRVGP